MPIKHGGMFARPRNMPASRPQCWPVIRLSPASTWSWPSGLRAIIQPTAFHPHDRFVTVLKGTWRVGSGTKFDANATVPMPAGSFVTHYGQQTHFDGAKDEETVLVIVGEGPATVTPAEVK